jgi:hypothetical protein
MISKTKKVVKPKVTKVVKSKVTKVSKKVVKPKVSKKVVKKVIKSKDIKKGGKMSISDIVIGTGSVVALAAATFYTKKYFDCQQKIKEIMLISPPQKAGKSNDFSLSDAVLGAGSFAALAAAGYYTKKQFDNTKKLRELEEKKILGHLTPEESKKLFQLKSAKLEQELNNKYEGKIPDNIKKILENNKTETSKNDQDDYIRELEKLSKSSKSVASFNTNKNTTFEHAIRKDAIKKLTEELNKYSILINSFNPASCEKYKIYDDFLTTKQCKNSKNNGELYRCKREYETSKKIDSDKIRDVLSILRCD